MNLLSQQTSFVLQFEPEKPIVFALYVLPVTLIVSAKEAPLIRQKLKKCYNKLHGSSHRIRDA